VRIATWNVERLRHKQELDKILLACEQAKADILVLTETDAQIHPSYRNCFHTLPLTGITVPRYKPTENRVSIFTNYNCAYQHPTYDPYTSLCVELETERGNLLVYGTIIGIFGNRNQNFKQDLPMQIEDFRRLTADGQSLCVCGDYNLSFADNYYFTADGRNQLLGCFAENHISLLTGDRTECVDHIAISNSFIQNASVVISEWNLDKKLSDHKGTLTELTWRVNTAK
jgi:exonuclease III